jgi:prepilin-type N-terminal cleavage/methylation domain-containing protein
MNAKGTNGFTLIELLVVIAIIGILASIILASLSSARQKGRDARRLSDIKEIQLALELYDDACGNYPVNIYTTTSNTCTAGGSITGLVQGGFISVVPYDPLASGSGVCSTGAQTGCYAYVGLCAAGGSCVPSSYHLGATLETNDASLQQDPDACPGGTVGSACTTGQGNNYDGPSGTNGAWYVANGNSDFYGQSTGSTGSSGMECSASYGTPYPGTERCFDAMP